jgi:hypothetical protein
VPQVIVDQPPPSKPPGSRGPARRLLSHVKVKVERGRLIVTFLLSARARVRMEPRTAGRLIGAARTSVLAKGRRRMVVTYRGSLPPAQLRIVARPAKSGKRACSNTRKRSRGGHCA